jgi:predicted outer membrane repeat protein
LSVTNSSFAANTAGQGGAIFNNEDTLTVTKSNFSDNSATNSAAEAPYTARTTVH